MNCVYTVITGDYDDLRPPKVKTEGWDYICFTDNPELKSDDWQIKVIREDLDPKLLSRKIKILSHIYLPEYIRTIYHDSSFVQTKDFTSLIHTYKANPLIFVISSGKRTAKDEMSKLMSYGMMTDEDVRRTKTFFENKGYTDRPGVMSRGGFIIRDHNIDNVIKFNEVWWNAVENTIYRDQVTIQYAVRNGYEGTPLQILPKRCYEYFEFCGHRKSYIKKPVIRYMTPAGSQKNIGEVYNGACELVTDPSDWIVLRDGDTMFLTDNWMQICEDAAERYPDTTIFGCYTNRIGLEYQLHHGFDDDPNIINHINIAKQCWEEHGSDCELIEEPVAGMFMMFRRELINHVRFQDDLVRYEGRRPIFFDYDFCKKVLNQKGRIRLIKGLYLFHKYRIDKDRRDISHLTDG